LSVAFSEEQRALQATAERFAREKLAPAYQAREREAAIDRALVREMGALGLIAGDLPEQYGGLGLPSETSGLIIEALAYGDVNVAYVQLLGSLCGQIIARHAAEELAAEWLPRIVSGENLVALALTEPRGGSDAANLALSARSSDTGCVLNGEKSSISIADQANAVLVFARTGRPQDVARGISAFLVPMNSVGVSTSRFNDLGSKAMGRGSIFFDEVHVPDRDRAPRTQRRCGMVDGRRACGAHSANSVSRGSPICTPTRTNPERAICCDVSALTEPIPQMDWTFFINCVNRSAFRPIATEMQTLWQVRVVYQQFGSAY